MRKLIASLGVAGLMLAGAASPALAHKPNKPPKVSQAQRLCERNNGLFVNVSPLVYACVLPTGATQKEIEQAARLCERRGGALFAAVGNVVYACVLPGGTLPGSILGPNGPIDTGGLRLFPIILT